MASAGSKQVVLAALGGSVALAAVKLGAVLGSSSSALLSSTVHSLIDMSALGLLFYGLRQAEAAAARSDRQGSDRALGFWSFVVAIPLYAMGAGVALYEGVERLSRPQQLASSAMDQLVLVAGVVLAAFVVWLAMQRLQGARAAGLPLSAIARRPANAAVTTVLIVSAASLLGHLVALAGLNLNASGQADPAASIAIGLVLAAVAAVMAIEVRRLLVTTTAATATSGVATGGNAMATSATAGATSGPDVAAAPALETKSMPAAAPPPAPGQKPQVVARGQGKRGRGKHRR